MKSLTDLYRIGYGPSSSHTMGPARAARIAKEKHPEADGFRVILYSSLAKTGKGHMTDAVVRKVLSPVPSEIIFDMDTPTPEHPNTMEIIAYKDGAELERFHVRSVGGGAIQMDGFKEAEAPEVYQEKNFEEIYQYCKENGLQLSVYCIANNGFIEGKQNEPLMRVFENFCVRAGLTWGGGVGIGGGVMLNVTRIVFLVQIAMLALGVVLSVAKTGNPFPKDTWISFGENAALLLFFNLGVLYYLGRMGRFIRKEAYSGKKYTRILIPSFVFILFADVFFIIISFFQGGLFRGWLARKPYEGDA